MKNSKKILVAPLDWGLGHTTRCIPIIAELIHSGCEVVLAGTNRTNTVLQGAFPHLRCVFLHGYNIEYPRNGRLFFWHLLLQIPKILYAINKENRWLNTIQKKENFDVIISDNRYGLYINSIPSVIVCHQMNLQVKAPSVVRKLVNSLHRTRLNKFTHIWIPDNPSHSLSGILSSLVDFSSSMQQKVSYLGAISRFSYRKNTKPYKYDVLLLLSGPEPQRSILEHMLLRQLQNNSLNIVVVRGLPNDAPKIEFTYPGLEIHNHLDASELKEKIETSYIVICRSGYTTLMDLYILRKNAILIPTPGQTEQEYLANYMNEMNFHMSGKQDKLNILAMIETYKKHTFRTPPVDQNNYLSIAVSRILAG